MKKIVIKNILPYVSVEDRIRILEKKRKLEIIRYQARMDYYARALEYLRKQV